MRTSLALYLLMIIVPIPVLAQTKPSDEKQPQRFDGAANPSWKTADGRTQLLFIDITTHEFLPADPRKADPGEILKSVSAEGAKLGTFLENFKLIYEFETPVIKGVTVFAGYTLVMVYPEKGTTGEGELKNPVTFSPGALMNLTQVVNKFGEPTGKQIWSDDLTRSIGLDGLVCWWGEVGVSASKDGKITHVLRRRLIKKT